MHTWHLAIVCFVYRLLVHRDEGCGAVYDLDSVVYKPFCVFTVQWMFMACRLELWTPLISGVQTHSQNRDTVQVLHGQNLGLCDFFSKMGDASFQRCEAWKMGHEWFYHSRDHLHVITSSTFCSLETTSRPRNLWGPSISPGSCTENRNTLLSNNPHFTDGNVFNTWGISETGWQ